MGWRSLADWPRCVRERRSRATRRRSNDLLATVTDGARCALAGQQQTVVGSLLALAGQRPRPHVVETDGEAPGPMLVTELLDIVDGQAIYDEEFTRKQPDWTYDEIDSGESPVDRLTDHRQD